MQSQTTGHLNFESCYEPVVISIQKATISTEYIYCLQHEQLCCTKFTIVEATVADYF